MIKLAIDCRMIDSSGIGNFLKNLLDHWILLNDYKLFLVGKREKLEKYESVNCIIIDCNLPIFSIKEFFLFPLKQVNRCDVFFSPNYNLPYGIKVPVISTIHDVVFLDNPSLVSKIGLALRYLYLRKAVIKSEKIITVSNFSKDRIKHFFGNKKDIKVIYNGITNALIDYGKAANKINEERQPYIVFVGNVKKHKGLSILLKAFSSLKKDGFVPKLIIVGEINNFKTGDPEIVKEVSINKEIIFTGKINDTALFKIIENANVLVQPSSYEGFGMPPLEALYLGTPVVVSEIPVFREIYSNLPVAFFDLSNVNDLKEKILKSNAADKKNFSCSKDEILKQFNYENSAKMLISIIRESVGENKK
ncbi:glycosyltransferase family 1 protein [Chryseobacterium sp.]|uniref:glycosyltransferase family 4 protein n=1 Tax=Chryseobacterium sp. TaxID=1871047 RepID=UPI0028A023C0|nr:glycosyltransferase family 1 protein [Chryseobacterium sp.]